MKDIEQKDECIYKKAAKTIRDEFDYGDVVPLDYLMALVNDPKPKEGDTAKDFERWSLRRMTHVGSVGMILLEEYKICLSNVRGVGYELIKPKNQADYALNRTMARIADEINNGQKIVTNINITVLSEPERNHAQAVENHIKIMNSLMANQIKKADKIAKILSE